MNNGNFFRDNSGLGPKFAVVSQISKSQSVFVLRIAFYHMRDKDTLKDLRNESRYPTATVKIFQRTIQTVEIVHLMI